MAQVNVTISGKLYRMACDDGEESHLAGLADQLNRSIEQLRERFGEIGDQRLTVMAAITLADGRSEAERRVKELEERLSDVEASTAADSERREAAESDVAAMVDVITDRVEALAGRIAGAGSNGHDRDA